MDTKFSGLPSFIWSVADLLRGEFKQSQYGRIILPFTLLRRLECVLEPTKDNVLAEVERCAKMNPDAADKVLLNRAGLSFYNTSPMNLSSLGENQVLDNLETYVQSFSPASREIFEHFRFTEFIEKLDEATLLYIVANKFANIDLSPATVPNYEMGLIFEELIRRFAESSNETAGEHFTPRDIVRLTTSLVFSGDSDVLTKAGIVRSIYDPTAGTGGFLSAGMEYLHELNPQARLVGFGQELNPESYAICKGDMLVKEQDVKNIKLGNTLSDDKLYAETFDYMLSNPPFGVDWKKIEKGVKDEQKIKGYGGRFGPGTPRVSDGSLLFLLHLISKMRDPKEGGSRIGIILNGSPLFTGGAGSGESEIRRYILERDILEAIIALPTDMFYNTGIATYIWVLSNHKPAERKGKVQLINASDMSAPMRKSLGSKRKYLTEEQIEDVVRLYDRFEPSKVCKIFKTTEFGYRRITVERPLQLAIYPHDADRLEALQADKAWENLDASTQQAILQALETLNEQYLSRDLFLKQLKKALRASDCKLTAANCKLLLKHLGDHSDAAEVCTDNKGNPEPNPDLRDNENVPLSEDIHTYFEREVLPHVPAAWIDESKKDEKDGLVGIVGYEIPFNRHFYEYIPPRPLEEIDADLDAVTAEIMQLLQEVHS